MGVLLASLVAVAVAIPNSAAGDDGSNVSGVTAQTAPGSDVCPYHNAWPNLTRFPRAPSIGAAYQYLALTIPQDHANLGFTITGPFPHANWMSWSVVDSRLVAFSVLSDNKINPDVRNANPFNPTTTPLSVTNRNYHILVVPGAGGIYTGTDVATRLDKNKFVQDARKQVQKGTGNLMVYPDTGSKFMIWAGRVYNPFPGYNRAGAGGPTATPYPVIHAFDLKTGKGVNCVNLNLWPDALLQNPNDLTSNTGGASDDARVAPADVVSRLKGLRDHNTAIAPSDITEVSGPLLSDPPTPLPNKVTFYRGPLSQTPGADVPTVPPPDQCSGYLQGNIDPNKIVIFRVPKVNTIFDNTRLSPSSTFASQSFNSKTFSINVVGTSVGLFLGRSAFSSAENANADIKLDPFGGATFVVWPTNLNAPARNAVIGLARLLGWNVLRGQQPGLLAASQVVFRTKGIQSSFSSGISPTPNASPPGPGAPCGQGMYGPDRKFNTYPAQYAPGKFLFASPQTMGPYAPLGVQCRPSQYFSGQCLGELVRFFRQTGGSYLNRD